MRKDNEHDTTDRKDELLPTTVCRARWWSLPPFTPSVCPDHKLNGDETFVVTISQRCSCVWGCVRELLLFTTTLLSLNGLVLQLFTTFVLFGLVTVGSRAVVQYWLSLTAAGSVLVGCRMFGWNMNKKCIMNKKYKIKPQLNLQSNFGTFDVCTPTSGKHWNCNHSTHYHACNRRN